MKLKISVLFFISIILLSFNSKINEQKESRHIFYIHGRILEIHGKNAYSEDFGNYEFDSIVSALKVKHAIVHQEIRHEDVNPKAYAIYVSKQIDSLIRTGIKPIDITVVGASKGAIIASNISNINTNPINYVLLAGNNDYLERHNNWKFHGQVLCIYDLSDRIAGKNYDYWKHRENYTTTFEQIEIKTNLGHGFLYKPLSEWVEPTKKWIMTQEL